MQMRLLTDTIITCPEKEAQAILSSDGNYIWHVSDYPSSKNCKFDDTVELFETDQYEYKQLKILNGKTPEEIIDAYTLSLIDGGIL